MKEIRAKKNIRGSITVEVLIILIPFLFAFGSIINLGRFIQAEMVIHRAITETAKEISTYSYIATKTKITARVQKTNKKSNEFKSDIDDIFDNLNGISQALGEGDIDGASGNWDEAKKTYNDYMDDPDKIVDGVKAMLLSEAADIVTSSVAASLARSSIKKELQIAGYDDADAYLKQLGVVNGLNGLDFGQSKWMSNTVEDANGRADIRIVVTFKLKNQLFPSVDIGEHQCMLSASTLCW